MPTEQSLARRWEPLFWDIAPVVVLLLVGLLTVEEGREQAPTGQYLVVAPLLVRRRWPIAVFVLVGIISALTSEQTTVPWVHVGAVGLASFTVGLRSSDRILAAIVVLFVTATISLGLIAQDADAFEALVFPFVVLAPAWLLGDIVRQRRLEAIAREEAHERRLREAEERVRAAVAEERRTMARELHDVVAHGVSVMVIQAGAARQVLDESPERATEALLTVEATGREAMAELRRLLGVLDDDEGEGAGVAPQPGMDQLGLLLERVREAGLPAELEVAGTPRPLPPSLDVTVYRIVQEGLTNALRYARRAATLVRLTWEPAQLRIEILDDGPSGASSGGGEGRGLVGMRERASRVGGRLEAGPRLGGGYAVRAWLPLGSEPS